MIYVTYIIQCVCVCVCAQELTQVDLITDPLFVIRSNGSCQVRKKIVD